MTKKPKSTSSKKACPICKEPVNVAALRCPHCQADLFLDLDVEMFARQVSGAPAES